MNAMHQTARLPNRWTMSKLTAIKCIGTNGRCFISLSERSHHNQTRATYITTLIYQEESYHVNEKV
ncbi:MAG: hypothetical protein ACXV5N_08975 [Halobacteriota archaeon]